MIWLLWILVVMNLFFLIILWLAFGVLYQRQGEVWRFSQLTAEALQILKYRLELSEYDPTGVIDVSSDDQKN